MSDYQLLINGQLVDGDHTMAVVNPANEEKLADCPKASEAQLNDAVAAAKAAFPAWSETAIEERKAVVLKIADAIEANATELAQLLTEEQGKPLGDATGEVYGMAAFCRYFTSLDLPVKVIDDSEGRKVEAHRRPQVVAPIPPRQPCQAGPDLRRVEGQARRSLLDQGQLLAQGLGRPAHQR